MAQKKSNEVDSWLARPDPGVAIVLIYGPDHGLTTERGRRLVASLGLPLDDPFGVVRLEASELEQQPGRLIDEARTVPMFAARRLLWIRGAALQRSLADSVRMLCADPPRDCMVVVEAGDLKKGAALRAAVEASPHAMALPCYADDDRTVERLIDEVLGAAGLDIAPDARLLLRRGLGGDRLATRSELEKLVLYAMGSGVITAAHVDALAGDASGLSIDDAVDAVLAGETARFDAIYSRQCQSATQTYAFLSGTTRQFTMLRSLRADVDAGKSTAAAVAASRPPIFFSRRSIVERALRASSADVEDALRRLYDCVLVTRREPALAVAVTRQTLLSLAMRMARAGR